MGKNSRLRRESRRRAQPRPTRVAPASAARRTADSTRHTLTQPELVSLIEVATRYAVVSPHAARPRIVQLNELGAAAAGPAYDPATLVVDQALSRIRAAWEHGWQPADLVHAARRRTSAAAARWVTRAVLVEAARTGAAHRAPREWALQLEVLAGRHDLPPAEPDSLLSPSGLSAVADWTVALVALDFLQRIPVSQRLMPPPSQWGQAPRPRSRPPGPGAPSPTVHGEGQAKTLTRVRALLAKAESTDFAAEAEAFTAKAQDLMTRHSIDEALLADEAGGSIDVQALRVLIHQPYAVEKSSLLNVVARANRTRTVWNDFASCATIVGVPTDIAQVEMLFTSTLVQATRAMTQAGQTSDRPGADRSSAFRKAFLTAYAHRIGERLTSSSAEAAASYGNDLVPVFQRQAEAVSGEYERLFPHVTTGSRRRSFDARGWDAGTRAANAAVLPAGEVEA